MCGIVKRKKLNSILHTPYLSTPESDFLSIFLQIKEKAERYAIEYLKNKNKSN